MSNTIYDVIQNIQQPMLSQLTKIPRFTSPYCNIYIRIYSSFFAMCIWLQYLIMIAERLLFVFLLCIPSYIL